MRLYYQDDMVRIWNGDCRRLSPIEDASVDLVITSPPWWICGDYRHPDQLGFGQSYAEFMADLTTIMGECRRCLRPGGRVVCWMADVQPRDGQVRVPLGPDTHPSLRDAGLQYEATIFWHSPLPEPPGDDAAAPLVANLERGPQHLLVYRKEGRREDVDPATLDASRIPDRFGRMRWDPVWVAAEHPGLGIEGQSPDWLLIRKFSLIGDTVLDPFTGSGSFLAAAKRLGRRGLGTELNEEICAEAAENCRKATTNANL